jgi:mycothiol synthase
VLAARCMVAVVTVDVENLVWRPLAVTDGEAMADLLNAIDAEDHVWGRYTAEDAAEELNSPVDDLSTSTLAAFDDASMVGFSAVHYTPAAESVHRVHAAGAVRPTHRRRGLGVKLMQHGLATARQLHAVHHPALRLVVESVYGEHVAGAVALYRASGMTATTWVRHMQHPLGAAIPDAAVPEGFRIEGYTPEADEEFRALRNEAVDDESGRSPLSAEEWKVYVVNASFRPESSSLIRDIGTGAGVGLVMVVSWDADTAATGVRDAYLRAITTLPEYRQRGVTEALIAHTLGTARDQGYARASLRVDAADSNPELVIYERAGFVTHDTQVHYSIEP